MAERYTGRHIRQARHGAWVNKKRSLLKPHRNMLPAAAALTVAGVLVGGAGAVIQLGEAGPNPADLASGYDPADYPPPDRDALADRASRDGARSAPGTTEGGSTNPEPNAAVATGTCEASYFSEPERTANGETSDPNELTAAHPTLPFDTELRVTNVATGKSVVVRINDHAPETGGQCLDLSRSAFKAIAPLGAGVVDVRYEVLVSDAT